MKWLLALTAVFALTASAADISGNWKGSAETTNGTIEHTSIFQVDGTKLTGNDAKMEYKGKVVDAA
jgi:hypothetical protein